MFDPGFRAAPSEWVGRATPEMNAFCFRIPLLEDGLAEARTWFVPPANMLIFSATRFLRRAMPGLFEQLSAAQEAIAATCLCTPASSPADRKSTRLNSSHRTISYAVFCLKKKRPAVKNA